MISQSLILLFYLLDSIHSLVCPDNWVYYDELCWLYRPSPLPFRSARSTCMREGGDLAAAPTHRHIQFVRALPTLTIHDNADTLLQRDHYPDVHIDDCFTLHVNSTILDKSFFSSSSSSLSHCRRLCRQSSILFSIPCDSYTHFPSTYECVLHSATREDISVTLPGADLYRDECWKSTPNQPDVQQLNDTKFRDDTPSIDVSNCYQRYPRQTVVGRADDMFENVTLSSCLSECSQCEDDDCMEGGGCHTALYYREYRECVLLAAELEQVNDWVSKDEADCDIYTKSECRKQSACSNHIDLIFILDGSDSIGGEEFNKSVDITKNILALLKNQKVGVQFTVFQVTDILSQETSFSMFSKESARFFETIKYRGGRSNMWNSVAEASNQLKSLTTPEFTHYIVISDGLWSDEHTATASSRIPHLHVLSTTQSHNRDELEKLIATWASVHEPPLHSTDADSASQLVFDAICSRRDTVKEMSTLEEDILNSSQAVEGRVETRGKNTTGNTSNERARRSTSEETEPPSVWLGLLLSDTGEWVWTDGTTMKKDVKERIQYAPAIGEKMCGYAKLSSLLSSPCHSRLPFVCTRPAYTTLDQLLRDKTEEAPVE